MIRSVGLSNVGVYECKGYKKSGAFFARTTLKVIGDLTLFFLIENFTFPFFVSITLLALATKNRSPPFVTVPRKTDHFRKIKNVQYSPNTDQNFVLFFLLAHRYLLPFSYTDTKFEWLKPLLKVRAPRLNTVTFYSLF